MIKYSESFMLPSDPKLQNPKYGDCLICCEEGYLIMNICGDSFCKDCWIGNLKAQFDSMCPSVACMNCSMPVLYETIIKIISYSEDAAKLRIRYEKLLC